MPQSPGGPAHWGCGSGHVAPFKATLSCLAWNWLRFQLWFLLTLYECVRQYKCMEPASKIDTLPLYVKTEHRPTCATRSAQSAKLPLWCAFIRVVVTWLNCPSWPITFHAFTDSEMFNGIFLQLSFCPKFLIKHWYYVENVSCFSSVCAIILMTPYHNVMLLEFGKDRHA